MTCTAKQPNVLMILTDDQGYGDLSRTGNRMLDTPNIDALAADGACLNQFYVQPVCAPTRAEVLTGRRYPFTGVCGVQEGAERINLDETLISDLFRQAGYATGCFGKWHSGAQYPYHPCARGFDEFIGFCCGHWSHYFDSTIEYNGEEYKTEGYLPDVLTDHAIDFMEQNRETPFFCYVPLNTPHAPWQVPDTYFEKFANLEITQPATEPDRETPDKTRCALAMCENIDCNVGRLVSRLKELELYEDTVIVYFSDNGPNSQRWNAGLRGTKGSIYEGGVRSPCSITYPRHLPEKTMLDSPTSATDLLPTLCGLCGIEVSTQHPVHGLDLGTALSREADIPERNVYAIAHHNRKTSVRRGRFRYHENGELYDLSADVGETQDLSGEQPQQAEALKQFLEDFKASFPPLREQSVIPVGYPAWPSTYLETQDAKLQGTLGRSSIHPNCSWICDWTALEDHLTWQIEIETTGTYEVRLMYSAHQGQLGSRFSATCGDACCNIDIHEEFNAPELRGFDRYPRDESYEKAFTQSVTGTLRLYKGCSEFRLTAVRMTGPEMPHIRALKVKLLLATPAEHA